MPIHAWTNVYPGLFHHFHQGWICALGDRLNGGGLPNSYYALLQRDEPSDVEGYAGKANRLVIHRLLGDVVAVVEILSPGNKTDRSSLQKTAKKITTRLERGIHVLVVDLFPPTQCDPRGIHKVIWDEVNEHPFELPADKPLTLTSYCAGPVKEAYVEPVAVGDPLPEMPLFLEPDCYVQVPLELTYMETWDKCPEILRQAATNPPGS